MRPCERSLDWVGCVRREVCFGHLRLGLDLGVLWLLMLTVVA
jgi:hypothetical protein